MKVVDTQGDSQILGLPKSGIIQIGAELVDLDWDLLQRELRKFYGDRYILDSAEPAVPDPAVVNPPTNDDMETVDDGIQDPDQGSSRKPRRNKPSAAASRSTSSADPDGHAE